uniref:Putative NADH dehydrogenase n=1 Tax=viral metagenome TaxID=1070528 RepID=A0A6M3IR91_9ZZZZ
MENKRCLITGSSGFIGNAICERLKAGYDILPLKQEDYYLPDFKSRLEEFNPQIIIHAAAYGNHSSQQDEMEMFEANVVKTLFLLHATKDIPYEAFINFGTSSEYGKKQIPMAETDLLEPVTLYGATKAAGTMLCRGFAKKYNKPIVTVRPFSVYGPGEADFRFIPTVVRSLVRNEEFNLEPAAFHDWIYIDDLVEGVLTIIDKAKILSGIAVNIGMGKQYSNKEVVSMLEFISGKKAKIKEMPMRFNDSPVWVANNNLLILCGWKPNVDLMVGLKRTYQYYKRLYENN